MCADSTLPPRCRAEIDCEAIRHNVQTCRELAGADCDVMAVVKADAYGHGLEKIGRVLADAGIGWYGVANVDEAVRLRDVAPNVEGILVLGAVFSDDERETILAHDFSASVSSIEEVKAFSAVANRLGKKARLHVSVDTGMGRMGIAPESAEAFFESVKTLENIQIEGVGTHFPSSDEDADFTRQQIREFQSILKRIQPLPSGCQIHLANSGGLIGFQQEMPEATLVRLGLAMYGVSPLSEFASRLKPVLSLKTKIILIRELKAGDSVSYGRTFIAEKSMRTATLAVGYGDGYPRHLSGSGIEVLIAGKRCPLLGRVTMDQIVVDISALDESEVSPGDDAVLIGTQGEETISTAEFATKAGTIPWEILTRLTNRVKRVYLKS